MTITSPQYGLRVAIADRIKDLIDNDVITRVVADSVRVRSLNSVAGFFGESPAHALPGIIVAMQAGEGVTPMGNVSFDLEPIVSIVIVDQSPSVVDLEAVVENADQDDWIGTTRLALINEFVDVGATVTSPSVEFHSCQILPGPYLDTSKLAQHKLVISTLNLRYKTRIIRRRTP